MTWTMPILAIFSAPILSADSQVVIYDQGGLFEPSGIRSLQILPTPPGLDDEPWLVPVGQAYFVEPEEGSDSPRLAWIVSHTDVAANSNPRDRKSGPHARGRP